KCYSGKLKSGVDVINSRTDSKERIGQIAVMIGKTRVETGELSTGDIATLVKLKETKVGDTLRDSSVIFNFKPIAFPKPVLFNAVKAEIKKEQEKLTYALHSFAQSDPTFQVYTDKTFNEFIISGMGEMQLDLMLKKLKVKTNINFVITPPRIAYKETIKRKAEAQGKYKKQSGGRGQYGDCHIRVEPLKRGSGIEFVDELFGGSIPSKYVPAVEKGVREKLQKGYVAGYELIDMRVALYDGSYHDVDSSDLAFQIAGSFAVDAVCEKATPIILEPIMNLEVQIPEIYMGEVIGDINSRRGRVSGMDSRDGVSIVKTQVPERELYKYATILRSITRGQGDFEASFSHYEEAPAEVAKKIVAEAEQYKKEAEENK
ncbi:elongation factor G, partial [Candidatus Dependentiae bacterium]|nr:elongation factor G [Candidatus Dependentiae bacterium]